MCRVLGGQLAPPERLPVDDELPRTVCILLNTPRRAVTKISGQPRVPEIVRLVYVRIGGDEPQLADVHARSVRPERPRRAGTRPSGPAERGVGDSANVRGRAPSARVVTDADGRGEICRRSEPSWRAARVIRTVA